MDFIIDLVSEKHIHILVDITSNNSNKKKMLAELIFDEINGSASEYRVYFPIRQFLDLGYLTKNNYFPINEECCFEKITEENYDTFFTRNSCDRYLQHLDYMLEVNSCYLSVSKKVSCLSDDSISNLRSDFNLELSHDALSVLTCLHCFGLITFPYSRDSIDYHYCDLSKKRKSIYYNNEGPIGAGGPTILELSFLLDYVDWRRLSSFGSVAKFHSMSRILNKIYKKKLHEFFLRHILKFFRKKSPEKNNIRNALIRYGKSCTYYNPVLSLTEMLGASEILLSCGKVNNKSKIISKQASLLLRDLYKDQKAIENDFRESWSLRNKLEHQSLTRMTLSQIELMMRVKNYIRDIIVKEIQALN